MSVCVLAQDGLYLGVQFLLQDNPQQVQSLGGVSHHRVVVSVHGHLQVLSGIKLNYRLKDAVCVTETHLPHLKVWPGTGGWWSL